MINSKQSVLEINGKKYDARTGKVLSSSPIQKNSNQLSKTIKKPMTNSGMMDISRPSPNATSRRRRITERSQTLMRQAVKKPGVKPTLKKVSHKSLSSDIGTSPKPIKSKLRLTSEQEIARQSRASKISRSSLVSKFGGSTKSNQAAQKTVAKITELPVKTAPSLSKRTTNNQTGKQVRANTIIEQGLQNAKSHTEQFNKKQISKRSSKKIIRRKILSYGAGTLAALLLLGFYAYQNIPNLSMRYATTRSGIHASLPKYKPAGFALSNKIEYNPGQVTVNFASNSDDREFRITQRETSWNSEALLSSYVTSKSEQIQKYEDKGKTIFLYGENNATWVNGGVWYDINGDSNLNSDQLIRIASSM